MMMQQDFAIRPEWLYTDAGLVSDHVVTVADGTIVDVTSAESHPDPPSPVPGLILPGFVNAHSHAFQRAFRGQVQWTNDPDDDFWTWRDRMYAVARSLDPDGIQAVSELAFLEMLEAGFTSVGEFHYLHRDVSGVSYDDPDELALRVIEAARTTGIRIALLRVVYAAGGFGQPLSEQQQRFRTDSPEEALRALERLRAHPDPRVTAGIAPHSVRAVPMDWLPHFRGVGPLHAHVSEQPAEVDACLAATGRTPLQVFADAGLVDSAFTAVHLTHPTAAELDLLRASGGRIGVCPTTELDLGDGFLPLAARDSIPLCIGTDSHARIDPLAEIRALEMHARGLSGRRVVMGTPGEPHALAERLLRHGTVDGANALGLDSGIRVGAPADFVRWSLDEPAAWGAPPLEAVVFAGHPGWVRDVWVGGSHVVEDGRHPRRKAVRERVRAYLQQ